MKITAITLTGDRPEAFRLCNRWVMQQTVKPDQWIVIDDGKTPMQADALPNYAQYIRREPQKSDPQHTLCLNMKEAMPYIKGDVIAVLEDDEYYAPRYIETMAGILEEYEIVGIGRSKYYHLPFAGYIRHMNLNHASLAQTAFRKSLIPMVAGLLEGNSFLDLRLWEKFNGAKTPLCDATNLKELERATDKGNGVIFDDGDQNCLYIGMKGLPGRAGIGSGHIASDAYTRDTNRATLKRWCRDYNQYLNLSVRL